MITVVLRDSEQAVTGPVNIVARMIPEPETVVGEVNDADRMRATESGGHPWMVRAAA